MLIQEEVLIKKHDSCQNILPCCFNVSIAIKYRKIFELEMLGEIPKARARNMIIKENSVFTNMKLSWAKEQGTLEATFMLQSKFNMACKGLKQWHTSQSKYGIRCTPNMEYGALQIWSMAHFKCEICYIPNMEYSTFYYEKCCKERTFKIHSPASNNHTEVNLIRMTIYNFSSLKMKLQNSIIIKNFAYLVSVFAKRMWFHE